MGGPEQDLRMRGGTDDELTRSLAVVGQPPVQQIGRIVAAAELIREHALRVVSIQPPLQHCVSRGSCDPGVELQL